MYGPALATLRTVDVVDFGAGTSVADWWVKGTRKQLRYTISDDAGDPFDLTGKALACYIADSDNATALITKTSAAGSITLSADAAGIAAGVQNQAVVALSASDANRRAKTYRHALWITTTDEEEVLSRGDAVLSDSASA